MSILKQPKSLISRLNFAGNFLNWLFEFFYRKSTVRPTCDGKIVEWSDSWFAICWFCYGFCPAWPFLHQRSHVCNLRHRISKKFGDSLHRNVIGGRFPKTGNRTCLKWEWMPETVTKLSLNKSLPKSR